MPEQLSKTSLPKRAEALPRRVPLLPPQQGDVITGATTGIQGTIGRRIGRGGDADVYEFQTLEGPAAIKLFRSHPSENPGSSSVSPEKEGSLQSSLSLTPEVHAVDSVEGRYLPYIVMEKAKGNLKNVIDGEPISLGKRIDILIDIARALGEVHDAGYLHRDVKPGNILMTSTGASLSDFGIATRQGSKETNNITNEDDILGSPAYISPERYLGQEETPSSDIYGWGLTAYEVLTGELPYFSNNSAALDSLAMTRFAHIYLQPRKFAQVLGESITPLHRALEPVVRKALANDPRERYSTAKELLQDLEKVRMQAESSEFDQVWKPVVINDSVLGDTGAMDSFRETQRLGTGDETIWFGPRVLPEDQLSTTWLHRDSVYISDAVHGREQDVRAASELPVNLPKIDEMLDGKDHNGRRVRRPMGITSFLRRPHQVMKTRDLVRSALVALDNGNPVDLSDDDNASLVDVRRNRRLRAGAALTLAGISPVIMDTLMSGVHLVENVAKIFLG